MVDTYEAKISVRNIVEFIMSSGDIDSRSRGIKDSEAMQEGNRIHKKIQKSMGENYTSEYPLKITLQQYDFLLTIDGRADGIINDDGDITIDEIKGVYQDLKYIEEAYSIHKYQVMCYAYIYANANMLKRIHIQITYCNIESEEIKRFRETYNIEFLEEWFMNLVREYAKWIKWQRDWLKVRNVTLKETDFPFEYRAGQRDLVTGVYKTIIRNKKLFIEAPTGTGKTLSAVFPATKAMGYNYCEKIFYLTAKTITRTAAEEAFNILTDKGMQIKIITLTAKEKLCIFDSSNCNPQACMRAKGHYDRINNAVFELINNENIITREIILEYSQKYNVCPFEMSLDGSLWVDCVICDYNYLFDPNVQLKRFFQYDKKRDYVFLIDEAHNLVDRAREMYSAVLYKSDFTEAKKIVKPISRKLEKKIETCNKYLLEKKRECDNVEIIESISSFIMNLMGLVEEFIIFFEENNTFEGDAQILQLYFDIMHFINMYERMGKDYLIYTDHEDSKGFKIKLLCVDPSKNLLDCLEKGKSAIFFSATLLPINYYKELLGGGEEDYAIYADSPFDSDMRLIMIGGNISTKYTRRNKNEYEKVIEYIINFTKSKIGNYLIFYPSYTLMNEILEHAGDSFNYANVLIQKNNMTEIQREEYLMAFSKEPKITTIGMAVMGGIFSEGIDLKEDRLIGAAIIGTGLPGVCNERELFRSYYDEKSNNGFEYSYLYPGMNKVLQSAGRVIRTEKDKGVILLLDERFITRQYKDLFPREWYPYFNVNKDTLSMKIDEFWGK